MRRPEKYVPVGVSFWDDDRIVEVGYMAGILFQQAMFCARREGTDGTVTISQIKRIKEYTPARWEALTTAIPAVPDKGPLIEELPLTKGTYVIPSWFKWHQSEDMRAADRERKASKGATK